MDSYASFDPYAYGRVVYKSYCIRMTGLSLLCITEPVSLLRCFLSSLMDVLYLTLYLSVVSIKNMPILLPRFLIELFCFVLCFVTGRYRMTSDRLLRVTEPLLLHCPRCHQSEKPKHKMCVIYALSVFADKQHARTG